MSWKKNRKLMEQGFGDLAYVPRGKCAWDVTLAGLAYGARMDITGEEPDLNAWAARHGVPGSGLYEALDEDAVVLWHGTSRERAEKIAMHGLFHKKGLWTAHHPKLPHAFCRMRSERFGTEGAVACLVVDRSALVAGRDYEMEGGGNVVRFQHGLPPDVMQYVLLHDEIRFTGTARAQGTPAWPMGHLKRSSGKWIPMQKTPVRYSDQLEFSTVEEFLQRTLDRLLAELRVASALEIFSVLYALTRPWDAVTHDHVISLIERHTKALPQRGGVRLFQALPHQGSASIGPSALF